MPKKKKRLSKHKKKPSSRPKKIIFNLVEALVRDDKGRLLLLKRSRENSFFVGKWQLPGGKVERGESPLHAIKREVKEETGCFPVALRQEKYFFFEWRFDGFDEKIALTVFSCKLKGSLHLCLDHSAHKFFKISAIKKSSLTPMSKKAIFE